MLWQTGPGQKRRTATVRPGDDPGPLPADLDIVASVSEGDDLRGQASYIQLDVPGAGPVLAWVGVPGGGPRDGCYVHPATGRTWPWGELRHAVRHALDHVGA